MRKAYKAAAYENEDGQYAIVIFGKSDKPKRISPVLEIVHAEMKQERQCVAAKCRYFRHGDLDTCVRHGAEAYGNVVTKVDGKAVRPAYEEEGE
jgi:hypothetical protein